MKKFIIIGWSSMVAFALIFATSVDAVAQEKVAASATNMAELNESVAATILAGTVRELRSEFAQLAQKKVEVTTEKTKATTTSKAKLTTGWFETNPDGTLKIPITEASSDVCNPSGTLFCAREYYLDNEDQPDEPTGNARKYNPL